MQCMEGGGADAINDGLNDGWWRRHWSCARAGRAAKHRTTTAVTAAGKDVEEALMERGAIARATRCGALIFVEQG